MKNCFLKILWIFAVLSFSLPALSNVEKQDVESAPDKRERIKQLKVKSLSDLQQLTPFESVSVIQKRYLPKTYRGEFNISVASVINHSFFYLGGVSVRTGFFLREDHGFGVDFFAFLPSINKQVANELISPPNGIVPLSLVFSQLYGGIYYKWSPIFGKFAILNNKIIYFDMYVTVGGGASNIVPGLSEEQRDLISVQNLPRLNQEQWNWSPTLSLSLGQIFAITQSVAFNWELKWFYTVVQFQNRDSYYTPWDINLSLGVNYYFPEAGYR